MLKGIEAEIGELGYLFARRPNAEHSALVLRTRLLRVKIVVQLTVASGHRRSFT